MNGFALKREEYEKGIITALTEIVLKIKNLNAAHFYDANTVAEDDPDTAAVDFRMDIFEAFSKGYIESASTFLTPVEKENLPYGALLFPYMQAVRFFADYINGDTYYKIKYPEHNLVRTRNQVALFKSALSKVERMQTFIGSL